jgi:hypothetical protein
MHLEAVEAEAAPQAEYFMDFKAVPAPIELGKAATLSFTPKMKGNEAAPVPLDLVHEKKMHLILVSDDLAWFDHIHPEYQASGAYEIKALGKGENFGDGRGKGETRFESGGKFWAFADYKPTGGLNTVDKIELNVVGAPAKAAWAGGRRWNAEVDGYRLEILTEQGSPAFAVGSPVVFRVAISKDGKTADPATFENYLGEKAHLVMVERGSKAYVHTHPAAKAAALEVSTQFAEPGTYRAWLQFQTGGKVHTADFVLEVAGDKITQ